MEVAAVTNSDDPKFDDIQNPDEEPDRSMFFEDSDDVGDASMDLDFPDESLLGENTSTFADELDMFGDLDAFTETAEVDELPMDDLVSVDEPVEQAEMIDDPILAAIENVPVVEDKKTKKAREKAEKAQAIAQAKAAKAQAKAEKAQAKATGKAPKEKPAKAEKPSTKEKPPKAKKEKKPKEPGDKQPQNVGTLAFMAGLVLMLLAFGGVNAYAFMKHGTGAMVFLAIFDALAAGALVIPVLLRRSKSTITASDVGMGIAAISLIVGCMFVLANLAYNLPS